MLLSYHSSSECPQKNVKEGLVFRKRGQTDKVADKEKDGENKTRTHNNQ